MPKREMREGFGNQVLDRGEGFRIDPRPMPLRECRYPKCKVIFQPNQPKHAYHHPQCQIDHANERKLAREKREREARQR